MPLVVKTRGERQGSTTPEAAHDGDCTLAAVGTQVTIVGGGSYQWGPELMADLLPPRRWRDAHIVLEDIDPAPLAQMRALADASTTPWSAKATFEPPPTCAVALDGADFVIVCISTGAFRSMAVDLDVPAAHGITQTVGDTVGPEASTAPCATSRSWSASARPWSSTAPMPGSSTSPTP